MLINYYFIIIIWCKIYVELKSTKLKSTVKILTYI